MPAKSNKGNNKRGGGQAASGSGRQAPPAPPRGARSPPPPPAPTRAAPTSIASRDIDRLASAFDEKAQLLVPVVNTPFPSRPGFGKQGKPVTLFVNHFRVKLRSDSDVYHYDVMMAEGDNKFTNEGLPKGLAQKVMNALLADMKRKHGNVVVVSDGRKNIYAPKRLPFAEQLFGDLTLPDDGKKQRTYTCLVREANPCAVRMEQLNALFAGQLNYTPYDAIQALDIALRHTASQRFVTVGRNLFSNAGAQNIGEGADVWFGYFQSLRSTQNRLVVNLDLAATAFVRAMGVLDYLVEALEVRDGSVPASLNPFQTSAFTKAIRGVKVEITHRGNVRRAYRVNGLSRTSASQTRFEDDNGRSMTVAQYFQQTYNIRLRYPNLPLLHVGAVNKKIYLPMEVCRILAGQKTPRKVTDKQVANMIRFTATRPDDRKRRIEQKVREANFDSDATLQAFGLEVDPRMVTAQGRILPAPQISYGNGPMVPRDGAWNMANKKYHQPASCASWAIISMCDPRRCPEADIEKFFKAVVNQASASGMNVPRVVPPIIVKRNRNDSVRGMFMQAVQKATSVYRAKPQLIWCINPSQDAHLYGELKRASDSEHGIVSQCMLAKHIPKCNAQYIGNILLKVNTKLGGKNAVLVNGPSPKVTEVPTIIFGADVTHPSPMDKTRPSIAAVVATVDRNHVKHVAAIRSQGHRVEQIENLKDMARELLLRFNRETNVQPQRILFYRDGVSEGQFPMVKNYEVIALREACASLSPNYKPAITFVIAQKRHNTRMFVSNAADADRSGNCKAGTVIDNGICHPIEHDFYLMSHAGIQGTSRPTHYHVVHDEIGFTADELQMLTYRLCYTFARCTRSVSIVPSAYYSHLVAFRARFFSMDGSETASQYSSESTTSADLRMLEVHEALRHSMYFV